MCYREIECESIHNNNIEIGDTLAKASSLKTKCDIDLLLSNRSFLGGNKPIFGLRPGRDCLYVLYIRTETHIT